MFNRRYAKKTAEERRAQAKQLQESIAAQVEDLRSSEGWISMLNFMQKFHRYSANNMLLIQAQCPEASLVAGFRQWQERGRQVRKGEKAIKIFGFAQRKAQAEDEGEKPQDDVEEQKLVTYFPVLSVFDISQTDPIDPTAPDPGEVAHKLVGADELGILPAVIDWLDSVGWAVEFQDLPEGLNGYTDTTGAHQVVISRKLGFAQAAKTALHEAAHVILHADLADGEYVAHRGLYETEAESTAYVVAGVLGLDTTDYTIGYVAGWSAGDAELIKSTAGNVLRAADTLIEALTAQEQEEVAAA